MIRGVITACMMVIFLTSVRLFAQNFSDGFSFYLPPDDTTSRRFMPHFPIDPIEADEFIEIADGRFAVKGKRIRFFGTNCTIEGAFPDQTKSGMVAGRLRKMGFNLVRFHHVDNGFSRESLFEWGRDTRHLNPVTLDRLEKYIAELKNNGIYIDMNLHVSRTFTTDDGVAVADSILNFGKGVTYFDRTLIDLQKEYATQLLTHLNPYTDLALRDDPVMAMVEITNENSLYRMWRSGSIRWQGDGGDFPMRHVRMLDTLWSDYLKSRYMDTESLQNAWNQDIRPEGADNQVKDSGMENDPIGRNWVLEQHETARATMAIEQTDPFEGSRCAHVDVTASDGTGWHIQWKQVGIEIVQDSLYTVTFAGRSDAGRNIGVAIQKDSDPWTVFYSTTFQLDRQWQVYQFSFRASATNRDTRLSFSLGEETGTYFFDDIRLGTSGIKGLEDGENLENGTVRRIAYSECVNFSDNRVRDISNFYQKLQEDYFSEMSGFLRNLGVRVPISGTNWNVGPGDMELQSQLDYIDNHAYWDHPSFPGTPWSSTDWVINNQPMVLDENGGTIPLLLGGTPMTGKPMTVSEYNHPFPNRYQSEGVLFITAYSSFHDIDAPMFFDYGGSQYDWETDMVSGYFAIHRNTAMMSLMPSCALAFRAGMISPARQTIELAFSKDDILLLPKKDNLHWTGPQLYSNKIALQHALRNSTFNSPVGFDDGELPAEPISPYRTDTDEIIWDTAGLLKITADRFVGMTGFLPDFPDHSAGPLTLRSFSDFVTLTWISLTDDKLTDAERSLLTISTKLQNTDMIWDGTTTLHNNWGEEPTEMFPVSLRLGFYMHADSIRLYPLDETGDTRAGRAGDRTIVPVADNYFEVELDQTDEQTVWWGIEKFGLGTHAGDNRIDEKPVNGWELGRNFPNPFNADTAIPFTVPRKTYVEIALYNTNGQKIRTLWNAEKTAGSHLIHWDGRMQTGQFAPSGMYLVQLKSADFQDRRKLLFVK